MLGHGIIGFGYKDLERIYSPYDFLWTQTFNQKLIFFLGGGGGGAMTYTFFVPTSLTILTQNRFALLVVLKIICMKMNTFQLYDTNSTAPTSESLYDLKAKRYFVLLNFTLHTFCLLDAQEKEGDIIKDHINFSFPQYRFNKLRFHSH